MPSVPTMRDDNNLPERTVIFMNITLLVLSAVPVNYRPAGDLCGTRWESWPPLNGPSCSCTGSLWEPAFTHWLSASQDMTQRSQRRNHLRLQCSVFKGAEGKDDAGLKCSLNVKWFLSNLQYFSGASLQLPPLWAPYSSERKGTCYTNHIHPAFTSHRTSLHPQTGNF